MGNKRCTAASHQTATKAEFERKVRRVRPWTEADLLVGECAECGSTLSWPAKKNPSMGQAQRDLFGEERPIFRALSDLSHDEIVALPRKAFTDAEWAELDDDVQEEIYEADEESKELITSFVDAFVDRYRWTQRPDHLDYSSAEEYFEEFLREHSRSGDLVELADGAGYDASEWIAEQVGLGYSEEQASKALEEALQDSNVYKFEYDTSEHGRAFFKDRVTESFWMDSTDVEELIIENRRGGNQHRAMFRDEIERALKEVSDQTGRIGNGLDLDFDDIVSSSPARKGRAREVSVDDVAEWLVDADPDWDKVTESALEKLAEEDPLGPLVGEAPPEARVLYRWKDGFYVQDLTPQELPAEGKKMGMCVGRPDMGYGKAVRDGEIKILSLRRPSGKPLFTMEAELEDGAIASVSQIAGNANRMPGFDLGRDGIDQPTIKKDEVERLVEFLQSINIDPVEAVNADGHPDMSSALAWISTHREDPWAAKMAEKINKDRDPDDTRWTVVKRNPPRRAPSCTAGDHSGCTGFCVPYRRRR